MTIGAVIVKANVYVTVTFDFMITIAFTVALTRTVIVTVTDTATVTVIVTLIVQFQHGMTPHWASSRNTSAEFAAVVYMQPLTSTTFRS